MEKVVQCDVIKMREMRGEVGKKPPKKEMDNHSFLWRHLSDFWAIFSIYMIFWSFTTYGCCHPYFIFSRKLDGSQKLLKDGDPWELMNLPIDYAIDLFNHVLRFINDNSGNWTTYFMQKLQEVSWYFVYIILEMFVRRARPDQ